MYSEKAETEAMSADYDYVKKATADSKVVIVDVREPDEVKEHGKIPNSINIPCKHYYFTHFSSTIPCEYDK